MPKMKTPPKFICVENVVGFETSETRNGMIEAVGQFWYML